MRRVAAMVCLLAVACSTSSKGTGGTGTGGSVGGSGDGGSDSAGSGGADALDSLGIQAKGEITNESLAKAGQTDVAFRFSPSKRARLRTNGILCSALSLDAELAYPAVVELANTDTTALTVELFSAWSSLDALMVSDVRPETSADLLHSCVAVAASEGENRYGFSQSSPSTFTIAPGNSLYVYAQRSVEEGSASISVTLVR
jgi:hypothetical protein